MGIKFVLTDSGTGVPMTFHVFSDIIIQMLNNKTYGTVACYYDEDSYLAGKRALHNDQIAVEGIPPQGADVLDWYQAQVVKAVDASIDVSQYPNRWMLSNGVVADRTPIPATAAVAPSTGSTDTSATTTTGEAASGSDTTAAAASGTADAAASGTTTQEAGTDAAQTEAASDTAAEQGTATGADTPAQ